ncbi:MAG: DUF1801 domain-containing protein [Acidimicrobiia bacterium]|nr:DUF1801 domain-containing protein [Acidimicrobiia bacterium]
MAENTSEKSATAAKKAASKLIDERIEELGDWRGEVLARVRRLVVRADPEVVEEWKWRGVPVWSHDGMICTGETYKNVVKITFAKGASLEDPAGLFNASLDGNTRRAIDLHEGDQLDEAAFQSLVRAAAALNASSAQRRRTPGQARSKGAAGKGERTEATKGRGRSGAAKPALLAGGNPRIPRADGDAPVQAYIEAMPGWKRDVGRRLDELVVRNLPDVRKAVKWNSPFYGIEGQGWLVSFHTFTNYVKVTFFPGTSLRPVPPGGTSDDARWIDVHEDDLDEAQLATWVKQAATLPGWVTSDIRA